MERCGGYAFAAMVHYRLSRSAHRTRDPAAADVFFAPILTKPKRHHALLAACAEVGGRTAVVQHILGSREIELVDTDSRMSGRPIPPAAPEEVAA